MTADAPRPFPDLPESIETIHIIGVAGTGMGSLAAMLKERGYDVRGSDAMAYPPMSDWLDEREIPVMIGYDEANLDWDPDLVIVGNVCRREYADAVAMRKRGFPHLSFPEALRHFFMSETRNLVVTGTHGKTTTTSMLAWLLADLGIDPSFMVGGITGNFGTNYRLGGGDVFVVEGDEYDTAYFDKVPKFWHYAPTRATINNVEFDHADIYPDIESIEHVFRRFVDLIPAHGSLWVNGDDERALEVSEACAGIRKTFGFGPSNDLRATDVRATGDGAMTANVHLDGELLGDVRLPTVGAFNVRNMLGAFALCMDEGASFTDLAASIEGFVPVKKRQELIGVVEDIWVFDDFAHHPTAVEATVNAMRTRFPERRIWAIFEAKSNTSRRRVFQDAYAPALEGADHVILSKPWRKDEGLRPEELLDIDVLADAIRARGPETELIPDVDAIVASVSERVEPGDIILGLSGSAFGGLHHKMIDALEDRFG